LGALTESRTSQSRDDEVTGELERQVPNKEDGDGGRELLGGHIEILHDTLELCRGQILSIDIIEDIEDTHDWPRISAVEEKSGKNEHDDTVCLSDDSLDCRIVVFLG
jgi:hypothetical protein